MSTLIGLDFESYGALSLPRYGLHRYINNATFVPLLAAVAWWEDTTCMSMLVDLTEDYPNRHTYLRELLAGNVITAHNAQFEQAVLSRMGIDIPSDRFVDSAVLARAAGAAGKLEAAAPQLLGSDKLEVGHDLIRLFAIPGRYQEESGSLAFDPRICTDHPDQWEVR
jgi:hypothetical protein